MVNPLKSRTMQQTMTSSTWLMPNPRLWRDDEVVVYTSAKNYTTRDYQQFFTDIRFKDGSDTIFIKRNCTLKRTVHDLCFSWSMYKDTAHLALDKFEHPGVDVFCLHGVNVSTAVAFSYAADEFPDSAPTPILANGDGTVNLRSLHRCLEWKGHSKHAFHHREFSGPLSEHLQILKNPTVINYIPTYVLHV